MLLLRDDVSLDSITLQYGAMPSFELLYLRFQRTDLCLEVGIAALNQNRSNRHPAAGLCNHRLDEAVRSAAHETFFRNPDHALRDRAKRNGDHTEQNHKSGNHTGCGKQSA